jgi:hypothetical protein
VTASTGEIAEDFARELLDTQRGFLDTLRGLTIGPSLREYLEEDRSRLMSLGRYLLAAVVINLVTYWGLGRAGFFGRTGSRQVIPPPASSPRSGRFSTGRRYRFSQRSFSRVFRPQPCAVFPTVRFAGGSGGGTRSAPPARKC